MNVHCLTFLPPSLRKLLTVTLFALWSGSQLTAQTIFPNLSDQALIDALATAYRPATVLDYGDARDYLYGGVDLRNDSLYCVYTGFGIKMTPGLDPSTEAFDKGINTEHTWPQSQGASQGNPNSDMHHLFPTQIDVNGDRGSLPFGEIPDNQTSKWYYLTQETTSIPGSNIRDLYSEIRTNALFEPREDHKGNVARAMFYFYTVYRAEGDAEGANYLPQMQDDLCDWHLADPVDERELARTEAIALQQDGKVNPFVVDCNLLARTYCPNQMGMTACLSATENPGIPAPFSIIGVGNNGTNSFVMLTIDRPVQLRINWYDTLGRKVSSDSRDWVSEGTFQLNVLREGNFIEANRFSGSHAGPLIGRLLLQDRQGHWFTGSVVLP